MLYNKDWDKKDIHSLDNLIEWIRGQNPAKGYHYWGGGHCLLAQYYRAMGVTHASVGQSEFLYPCDMGSLPRGFDAIAHGNIFTNTFGHALNRALKFKKEQDICPMLQSRVW
jgi:hypothetical protein